MIQLVLDISPLPKIIKLEDNRFFTAEELRQIVNDHCNETFAHPFDFYLEHNGKICNGKCIAEGVVHAIPRLRGGKGGFGSMLRAIGAQIEKTTNREACRDLSGRRLRDINEEKRLKKWLAEQAEREQEAVKRKRRKLEKLTEIVNHEFVNEDYTKARLEMPEKIHEAVAEGLKAADEPSSSKEVTKKNKEPTKKKIKGGLWIEDLDSFDDLSESDDEAAPKKKAKVLS